LARSLPAYERRAHQCSFASERRSVVWATAPVLKLDAADFLF
jgi:hypothetical protein